MESNLSQYNRESNNSIKKSIGYIRTFLEYPLIRKSVGILNKLRVPVAQPYYNLIHKIKRDRIKKLIPNSLDLLNKKTFPTDESNLSKDIPIYTMWLQGKEAMPPIVRLCRESIEKNKQNHPIIDIDQSNLDVYIDSLPQYGEKIKKWYQRGIITIQYLSDIVRAGLLTANGGIWIDATLCLTKPIDEIILNPFFYSFKRSHENINWAFVAENRWTAFFLASQKNCNLIKFLYSALVECIENYGGIPDYFTIDYILAIAYHENTEIRTFIDGLPSIKPNIGRLIQVDEGITETKFQEVFHSSPAFKFDWRKPIKDFDEQGELTIYSRLKSYFT